MLICGGTSHTKNLFSILKKQFYEYSNENYIVKKSMSVVNDPKTDQTVWKGAALLSELPCCRNNWITKSEYDQDKNIVFQKNEFKINYRFS